MNHRKIQSCIVSGVLAFVLLFSGVLMIFGLLPNHNTRMVVAGTCLAVGSGYQFRNFIAELRAK